MSSEEGTQNSGKKKILEKKKFSESRIKLEKTQEEINIMDTVLVTEDEKNPF